MTHEDISGAEIHVGDYIVYAALWNRSATLKYGRVVSQGSRSDGWKGTETPTVRAITVDRHWRYGEEKRWELQNNGKPISLGFLDRLLVVPETLVPAGARSALAS